jgi:2-methylcitrate dehydratase PrpD
MTIELTDGRRLHKYIEHAVGSLEAPMTDADLERKFTDLAEGILPAEKTRRVIELCWRVEDLPNVAEIVAAGVAV